MLMAHAQIPRKCFFIQASFMSQAIKEGAFTVHMTPDEVAKVDGI